jgi:hypothetical protein
VVLGGVIARANDFIDDGQVNGSDTRTGASTSSAAQAPRTFGGDAAARARLGAQLEESERARTAAGAPSADQVADAMGGIAAQIRGGPAPADSRPASRPPVTSDLDQAAAVLNGISDHIEAQRRELDRTAPTRGMTAALQGGTGQ